MELVELLAADSILKNDPDKEFDELCFAVDNDGTNILVIINKGEMKKQRWKWQRRFWQIKKRKKSK